MFQQNASVPLQIFFIGIEMEYCKGKQSHNDRMTTIGFFFVPKDIFVQFILTF